MTTFRGLGPALRIVQHPSLGANPATIIDKTDGMMPRTAGEPSLSAALALLSSDEVADYQSWGSKEKLQFLSGYQYLAVATAAGLQRSDGTPFDGFLTQGISIALGAMDAAQAYFKLMPADAAVAADQAASVLQEASSKTEPRGLAFVKKYALLRDRAAWELATQNDLTLEYEIVGNDPANPGMIYTRKIGEDRPPDFSAVFSTRLPSELYQDGLDLQDKFETLGVTFKKLNTLGANRRLGAGPALILAILITLIVAVLTFFWLWNHVNEQNKLTKLAVDFVTNDTSLSPADKADRLAKLKTANNFFGEVFGASDIPWTAILITVGVGVLALLAYPYVVAAINPKHRGYLGYSS